MVWTRGRHTRAQQQNRDDDDAVRARLFLLGLSGPCVRGLGGGDQKVSALQQQGDAAVDVCM